MYYVADVLYVLSCRFLQINSCIVYILLHCFQFYARQISVVVKLFFVAIRIDRFSYRGDFANAVFAHFTHTTLMHSYIAFLKGPEVFIKIISKLTQNLFLMEGSDTYQLLLVL